MEYWAYGLGITSNARIPAFAPSQSLKAADITFEIGPIPVWALEATLNPGEIVCSPAFARQADSNLTITSFLSGKFLELKYGDGTRFVVDGAVTSIWAEAGPGLTHDDVFTYLVGPLMGFALQRRRRLALHASSVVVGGIAIAICGEAGSGKSTTAAGLALRGHPVLSEDVCPLQETPMGYLVVPGYPRISLWPDVVDTLFPHPNTLPLIVAGWDKRYLELDGRLASFAGRPAPLSAIYLLASRSNHSAAPSIECLSQRQAALALVQNTYMNYLLTKDQRAAEFFAIAKLVTQVACFRVTPHADPARLGDLVTLLESHSANLTFGSQPPCAPAVRADVQS